MALLKPSVIAAVFAAAACVVSSARAADLPSDPCTLLPAAEVSQTLGQAYAAPQKSEAPAPFAGTNTGTDCNYRSKSKSKLWFRIYADPSPAAATDLFARLSKFYQPSVPVKGVGDEAYFDSQHALHVRKGKVRFYLNLSPTSPSTEKQLKDLATAVAGRI